MNKYILFSVVVIACFALALAEDEFKEYTEKLEEAQELIAYAKRTMKNDYIQNFSQTLLDGVHELDARTKEQLKTETNAAKRKQLIDYGTDAFKRLIVFLNEVKERLE